MLLGFKHFWALFLIWIKPSLVHMFTIYTLPNQRSRIVELRNLPTNWFNTHDRTIKLVMVVDQKPRGIRQDKDRFTLSVLIGKT